MLQKAHLKRSLDIIPCIHALLVESIRFFVIDRQTRHNYKKYKKDQFQTEMKIEPRWYDDCYWHVKFYGNTVYVYTESLNGPLKQTTGVNATSGELIGFRKSIIITRKKQLDLI